MSAPPSADGEPVVRDRGRRCWCSSACVGTVASASRSRGLSDARVAARPTGSSPAAITADDLRAAMIDQETGVRGYVLSGDERFLDPYRTGRRDADAALARLRALAALDGVQPFAAADRGGRRRAARAGETDYAEPTIALGALATRGGARSRRAVEAGKAALRRVPRGASPGCRRCSTRRARTPATGCDRNADIVLLLGARHRHRVLLSVAAVALVAARDDRAAAAARSPRGVRDGRARATSSARCTGSGAREVVDLAEDVDAMRARIVAELAALRDGRVRPAALQRRARAVRLRRLARPAGAAAQGRVASASCSSSATAASSTRAPTSTSASPSTARGACRT